MFVTCMDTHPEATAFYYKLHRCLKKAMADKELACHVNSIIVQLGKASKASTHIILRILMFGVITSWGG